MLSVAAATLLGTLSEAAAAAPVTVAPSTTADSTPVNDTDTGSCPAAPCSLRQAINYVQNNAGGGTVDLTFTPSATTYTVNGALVIDKGTAPSVAVVGPGNPRLLTIKNTGASSSVFNIGTAANSVTISGLTITGGAGALQGGGVFNNSKLVLNNDEITGNAVSGGGTTTAQGGAIYNGSSGTLTLTNSAVTSNTVNGSTGNAANGGAIANANTSPNPAVVIANSTITANTVNGGLLGTASGGGIWQAGAATLTLANVTLNGNTSQGGSASGGNLSGGTAAVRNTIISGGTAASGSENCGGVTVTDVGYNIEDRNQCGLTGAGDQVNTDPKLQALSTAGFTDVEPESATSPGIDRGNPNGCIGSTSAALATDQVGHPRGTPCDIGAYELSLPPRIVTGAAVVGTPQTGTTLACSAATFTGLAPITLAFSWLRDGVAIAGAIGQNYVPLSSDLDHFVSCATTATNVDGTATAVSDAVMVTLPPLPPFDGVTLLNSRFTVRSSQIQLQLQCSRNAVFGCGGQIKVSTVPSAAKSAAGTAQVAARRKKSRKHKKPTPTTTGETITLGTGNYKLGTGQVAFVPIVIDHAGKVAIAGQPGGRRRVLIQINAIDGAARQKLTSFQGEVTAPPSKKGKKRKTKKKA